MTALLGLKSRRQPSPGILPLDKEQEPSSIHRRFSLLQRLLPMDSASQGVEKGLELVAAGIQPM